MDIAQAKELLGGMPTTQDQARYKFAHALTLLFAFSERDEDKLDGFSTECEYKGEQYVVKVEKLPKVAAAGG